jgi:hypothetical protein
MAISLSKYTLVFGYMCLHTLSLFAGNNALSAPTFTDVFKPVCDTILLKNGQIVIAVVVEKTRENIFYRECGVSGNTIQMPINYIVSIKKSIKSPKPEKTSDTVYYNAGIRVESPLLKSKYDTIIMRGGTERIVTITDENDVFISFVDTVKYDKNIYQMKRTEFDSIKYKQKVKSKVAYNIVKKGYVVDTVNTNKKFYLTGVGSLVFPMALHSVGYQSSEYVGFGISRLDYASLGESLSLHLINYTLDYRINFKKHTLTLHCGLVAKNSKLDYDVSWRVYPSINRFTRGLTWVRYTRFRLNFGVSIFLSNFQAEYIKSKRISNVNTGTLGFHFGWYFPKRILKRDL